MSRLAQLQKATSLKELADLLNFKTSALSYLLYKVSEANKYTEFEIRKKNGGKRKIKAPIDSLKLLQRRLANLLSDCFEGMVATNTKQKSLSHGFRKKHSIVTNANNHTNKRYVFNVDLQDFFPSINLGRVRGFFIKNNHFKLHPKVATVIAQIACSNNELPQGSPCSPIISNLIGHLLDVRMVSLAKKAKCTYSRYADDLTFSTNKKIFPDSIAATTSEKKWVAGKTLVAEIEKMGFSINTAKTSMQYKTSRQTTTGLIVNRKINIKKEYYRKARSMCHALFNTGEFYVEKLPIISKNPAGNRTPQNTVKGTLNQLEGILSFIYQIKHPYLIPDDTQQSKLKNKPTAITTLYRKLLFYKYFFANQKPLIVCEGKTDITYLRCALKQLKHQYAELIQGDGERADYRIGFLNISKNLRNVLGIASGSSGLLHLMNMYEDGMKTFRSLGKQHPVIVLADNDEGAKCIKDRIKNKMGSAKIVKTYNRFCHNLYVIIAPETGGSIEDLFDAKTLDIRLDGKKLHRGNKKMNSETEYSKSVFAEKVVRAKQNEIDFSGFGQVFDKIRSVRSEHQNG